MPVIIENNNYTNLFGYSGSTYKSNAGDRTALELTVAESIRITTVNNPFSFDPILNILTSPAESWTDEGFRVNDTVLIGKYDKNGTLLMGYILTVTSLTSNQMNLNNWYSNLFYNIADSEVMTVTAMVPSSSITPRKREDLLIALNHSSNDINGSAASLIDGELTRMFFGNLSTLGVGQTMNGSIVGNESGQFLESSSIEYLGLNSDNFQQYKLTFIFINSGIYDKDWFALGDCLKLFISGLWSSKVGEVFDRTPFKFDNQANTGWYNESNNITIPIASSVVSQINELKYNLSNNVVSFEVNLGGSSISSLAIGGAYVSIDDTYYKNQPYNQNNLTFLKETSAITGSTTLTSNFGAGSNAAARWSIDIISIVASGSNAIVTLDWKPNTDLQNFFDTDRADGDKLFYLWVKVANTNYLVYEKQLIKELPVGGALTMNTNYGYLDHGENVTEKIGSQITQFSADTEDDIGYYGTFNLDLNKQTYVGINLRVEAYNTVSNAAFTLQQTNFSFASVIYQSLSGKYLLNETASINTDLPLTSEKRNATIVLTGNDTATQYEVAVYYPYLLNWRYWLPLLAASTDFAPTQNQNWEQYDNLGNWQIRTVVELNDNNLAFVHSDVITNNPYDNDNNVTSAIALQKQSDNSVVTIIPNGELLFIESTHTLTTGNWDIQKIWGMITIEPTKASPRSICSTIVPFDNNAANPLTPISGLLCQIDYITSNIIKLKCKFDPSKIDLTNGVKITAKIKQGLNNIVTVNKITTADADKYTTTNDDKIIS